MVSTSNGKRQAKKAVPTQEVETTFIPEIVHNDEYTAEDIYPPTTVFVPKPEPVVPSTKTKPVNRQLIYLDSVFSSLITPDRLFETIGIDAMTLAGDITLEGIKTIVPIQALNAKEQAIFTDLTHCFKHLGAATNPGFVIYDEQYVQKFFSYPRIGLRDGKIGMLIGAENKDQNHKNIFVEMVYNPEANDGEGAYFFGNYKCSLVPQPNNKDKDNPKYLVSFKSDLYIYHIPLKLLDSLEPGEIPSAYEQGRFEDVLQNFYGNFGIVNRMFTETFKNGTFPETGILFILSNARVQENEYEGQILTSTKWSIDACSHPEFLAYAYNSMERKNDIVTTLSNFTSLSCNESCSLTKYVKETGTVPKYAALYIIGRHKTKIEWIPTHNSYVNPNFMPPAVVSKFGELVKILREKLSESASLPANSYTPAALKGDAEDDRLKDF